MRLNSRLTRIVTAGNLKKAGLTALKIGLEVVAEEIGRRIVRRERRRAAKRGLGEARIGVDKGSQGT